MDAVPSPTGGDRDASQNEPDLESAQPASGVEGGFRVRLGVHLREIRVGLGLSLSDVQQLSSGTVSAPALSSYERADRAITAARLALLAGLYGIPISALLPTRARSGPIDSHLRAEFDLAALRALEPDEVVDSLIRFLEHIVRLRRTDSARVAVRHTDLVAMAALCQLSVDALVDTYGQSVPIVP